MQTFLPEPDFYRSAQVLDRKRLGKQRVETLQLLQTLTSSGRGWKSHPAAKMWDGFLDALVDYGLAICTVWKSYGYMDSCYDKIISFHTGSREVEVPPWFGSPEFHLSHQSNLIRKKPEHYQQLWPSVPDNLPYVWPA
jgi:hypothetical protein